MKFLITGGCGFVGRVLTAFFIQKGQDVRVLDKRRQIGPPKAKRGHPQVSRRYRMTTVMPDD